MFRSFFTTIFRGPPLCFVPLLFLPLISVRWVRIITQYVAACLCHLCVCLVFLSVGDLDLVCHLCVFGVLVCWWLDHQQTRTLNTHRWYTHAATYCVITRTQRTQISGRNSNGTKHSQGPPEDGREEIPKYVGVLYLQTRF